MARSTSARWLNSSSESSAGRMGFGPVPIGGRLLVHDGGAHHLVQVRTSLSGSSSDLLKAAFMACTVCLVSVAALRFRNYLCCGSGGWVASWGADLGLQLGERSAVC